jgi:small subunit ribosomal protein S8
MSMNDPLGDMLTRIRNGQMARKPVVACPHSKFQCSVLDVFKDEGFIRGYKVVDLGNNKRGIEIELKYMDGHQPVIQDLKRVSTPGRRTYTQIKDLKAVRNGLGVTVISTPQGVMADYKARAANVGGEVLCQVF